MEKAAEDLETFNEFSHACSNSIFGVKKGITEPAELHNAANGLSKGIGYITKSVASMHLLGEKKVVKEDGRETKELGFPNFLSMDYYYFLELEFKNVTNFRIKL